MPFRAHFDYLPHHLGEYILRKTYVDQSRFLRPSGSVRVRRHTEWIADASDNGGGSLEV